ncbi:hypothetical protein HD554DRAFT_2207210 [Boletus coccyginus]|nr:hypothetical protein HD554DRAFT_2207210 [Boletus coccyginus]
MHAYGHKWACQLTFNPHLSVGLGLSDGEGTEYLWSHMIKLIRIELVLFYHQAAVVSNEMQAGLRDWIKCRLCCGVQDQGKAALDEIEQCSISHNISNDMLVALQSLQCMHDHLMSKVDILYASLNVDNKFPELQDINLDFVQTLLLAIGSFFKWDKLDQAVGGAQKALELYDPLWLIPLPTPLPIKLNKLRSDQSLMEDANNLCWWFGNELATVELALHTPGNELLTLPPHWSGPLALRVRFNTHIKDTTILAIQLSGRVPEILLHWVNSTILEASPDEEQAKVNSIRELTTILDPEQIILINYLAEEISSPFDNDTTHDDLNIPSVEIVWNLPTVPLGAETTAQG